MNHIDVLPRLLSPKQVAQAIAICVTGLNDRPGRRYASKGARISDHRAVHQPERQVPDIVAPNDVALIIAVELANADHRPICRDVAPPVDDPTEVPLMNQIAVFPLVSRQSKSLMPSPLKSPVPTIVQLADTLPTALDNRTPEPFISQTARLVSFPITVEVARCNHRPNGWNGPDA